MGFLNPLFLTAAALVAVPVILHLFHRHRSHRVAFPALRYLQRTERDHARRIRLRQLFLLLLRSAVIVLLVAAGARLFLEGRGASHDPTALAIVLDNSLSSGRVAGAERFLDQLRDLAEASVRAAGPEDRIWVIRVGEPWDVAVPGGAEEALRKVESTRVSAAPGDLGAALERARGLVRSAGLPAAEIHLLSDLQATAFADARAPDPAEGSRIPVVVWRDEAEPPPNHWVSDVEVGGGLPPLANRRTDVAVHLGAAPDTDRVALPVRLIIGERIRAAATARPGGSALLNVGPFPPGPVHGWVETDPDPLSDDDRRPFSFVVRPPVGVALEGPASFFLEQGLGVLAEGGRARPSEASDADILFAVAGAGASNRRPGQSLVVVPPEDPTLLPALNRRLSTAGIPWRYGAPGGAGETPLGESRLPLDLDGVRVLRHYSLAPTGSAPEGVLLLRLADGAAFLVEGRTANGPYLLLAVPPEPAWTTLPLAAAMVPFLEWAISRAGSPGGGPIAVAGASLSTSAQATHVETPDGTRFEVDGTRSFARTRDVGIYTILREDSVLERVAVVPPSSESRLERVDEERLETLVGSGIVTVSDPGAWRGEIFTNRQGPELWRPLLLAALVLLLVEARIAAAGSVRTPGAIPLSPDQQESKQARAVP